MPGSRVARPFKGQQPKVHPLLDGTNELGLFLSRDSSSKFCCEDGPDFGLVELALIDDFFFEDFVFFSLKRNQILKIFSPF